MPNRFLFTLVNIKNKKKRKEKKRKEKKREEKKSFLGTSKVKHMEVNR